MNPIHDRAIRDALALEDSARAVPDLIGYRIADPGAFLRRMSEGAKHAPNLEEAVAAGVKACGSEFGDFLAQRYGGRVAEVVAKLEAARPTMSKREAA